MPLLCQQNKYNRLMEEDRQAKGWTVDCCY